MVEDAATVADIATAMNPGEPVDPQVERHQWATESREDVIRRQVAERDGRPVGYVISFHVNWPEDDEARAGFFFVGLLPELMTSSRLAQLIAAGEALLRADGARRFAIGARGDERALIKAIGAGGYREDDPSRLWELDLIEGREHLSELVRAAGRRMDAAGMRVCTVADFGVNNALDGLFDVTMRAGRDLPRTVPMPDLPRSSWDRWHSSLDVRWDRSWIAVRDQRILGLSYLRYPPVRGNVWTGFTASDPDHRGQGIASGAKMPTLMQAIELGVERVRARNDSRNGPMLAINARLGYQALPDELRFFREI